MRLVLSTQLQLGGLILLMVGTNASAGDLYTTAQLIKSAKESPDAGKQLRELLTDVKREEEAASDSDADPREAVKEKQKELDHEKQRALLYSELTELKKEWQNKDLKAATARAFADKFETLPNNSEVELKSGKPIAVQVSSSDIKGPFRLWAVLTPTDKVGDNYQKAEVRYEIRAVPDGDKTIKNSFLSSLFKRKQLDQSDLETFAKNYPTRHLATKALSVDLVAGKPIDADIEKALNDASKKSSSAIVGGSSRNLLGVLDKAKSAAEQVGVNEPVYQLQGELKDLQEQTDPNAHRNQILNAKKRLIEFAQKNKVDGLSECDLLVRAVGWEGLSADEKENLCADKKPQEPVSRTRRLAARADDEDEESHSSKKSAPSKEEKAANDAQLRAMQDQVQALNAQMFSFQTCVSAYANSSAGQENKNLLAPFQKPFENMVQQGMYSVMMGEMLGILSKDGSMMMEDPDEAAKRIVGKYSKSDAEFLRNELVKIGKVMAWAGGALGNIAGASDQGLFNPEIANDPKVRTYQMYFHAAQLLSDELSKVLNQRQLASMDGLQGGINANGVSPSSVPVVGGTPGQSPNRLIQSVRPADAVRNQPMNQPVIMPSGTGRTRPPYNGI